MLDPSSQGDDTQQQQSDTQQGAGVVKAEWSVEDDPGKPWFHHVWAFGSFFGTGLLAAVSYLDPGATSTPGFLPGDARWGWAGHSCGQRPTSQARQSLSAPRSTHSKRAHFHWGALHLTAGNLEADIQLGVASGMSLLWWTAICCLVFVSVQELQQQRTLGLSTPEDEGGAAPQLTRAAAPSPTVAPRRAPPRRRAFASSAWLGASGW